MNTNLSTQDQSQTNYPSHSQTNPLSSFDPEQQSQQQTSSNVIYIENQSPHNALSSKSEGEDGKRDINILNIVKAVKKDSSKTTFNELGQKVSKMSLNPNDNNDTQNGTGTLSDLRAIVNAEESMGNVEKDVPTPSGIENCRFFIMKMLDEPFSGRNYPLKSHIKDNSSKNDGTPNAKPKEKPINFSYFVKQNALVNYYDNSPVKKRDINPQKVKELLGIEHEHEHDDHDQGNDLYQRDNVHIQTVDFEDIDAKKDKDRSKDLDEGNSSKNQERNMQFSNFQVFATKDSSNIQSEVVSKGKSFSIEDNNNNNNTNTRNPNNNSLNSNASKGSGSNNMFVNMNLNMNLVAPGYIGYGGGINTLKSMSSALEDNTQPIAQYPNQIPNQRKKKDSIGKQSQFPKTKDFKGRDAYHNPNAQYQYQNQMPNQMNYNQPFDLLMPQNKQIGLPPWNQGNMNMYMNMNMFNPSIMQSAGNGNMHQKQQQDYLMNQYINQQQADYYQHQLIQQQQVNAKINQYLQHQQFQMQQQQQQQQNIQQQQHQQQQQREQYSNQIIQKKKGRFLMQNLNSLTTSELIKNSITICKDQSGCRFLQKKIDENPSLAQQIIQSIFENAIEIITDPFGNYLIQKLFDYMLSDQLCQLMALIQIYISQMCCNSYGTRVIQKLIDYLNTESLIRTFSNLIKSVIKDIILDINGSHIVLKIIDLNNPISTKVVYEEICSNIIPIATHKHGCCVFQKCIEKSTPKYTPKLFALLIENCQELILNQCGNYIIQYVITLQNEYLHEGITDLLVLDILSFSKQKYSSNVVEKCFECCSDKICIKLLMALRDSSICVKLLFDKFGNYVIQKALQRADDDYQHFILNSIAPCIQKLKNYPFGIKLYNKLIITYPYLSQKMLKVGMGIGIGGDIGENVMISNSINNNNNEIGNDNEDGNEEENDNEEGRSSEDLGDDCNGNGNEDDDGNGDDDYNEESNK